jgi:hypothetical protein
MKIRLSSILYLLCAVLLVSCTSSIVKQSEEAPDYEAIFSSAYSQLNVQTPTARTNKEPLVMAHYMPWFQAPPIEDGYGFHWHEGGGVFDPFNTLPDGRAQIASHYYPLTGPYDTRDIPVLEYQVSLMKMSGIGGVIIDWYGIDDVLDYKILHESTQVLIDVIRRAGLKFIICYEDQTLGKMIEAAAITKDDAMGVGVRTLQWMQENWFTDEAYVKYEGRPVLMTFGPQYYKNREQWDELFSVTNPRPYFITLNHHNENFADGSYNWMPMELSGGRNLALSNLVKDMNAFYEKQYNKPYLVATAFSGFHDIYRQAGHGFSYGFLDYAEGRTFELTFSAAEKAYPDIIQVATWNDYGEGAIIEPTIERGYKELEYLQDNKKEWSEDFAWNYNDLRSPIELYKVLVSEKATPEQKAAAQDAVNAVFAGDMDGFRAAFRASGAVASFAVSPILRDPSTASAAASVEVAFDPAGRKNVALGKPIVVSSNIYDFVGSKAIDGDTASYWEGGSNKYPNNLNIDLITPTNVNTLVIRLNPARIWGKRSQTIEVQIGNDRDNFTTLIPATDYGFDPATGNMVAIPLNVQTRYIQLIITNNSEAAAGQIAELEVYAE